MVSTCDLSYAKLLFNQTNPLELTRLSDIRTSLTLVDQLIGIGQKNNLETIRC